MTLQVLLERLKDNHPATRVETLRILAMVEETQAIQAVAEIYRNDPDAGVRQVALWAGRLLWQAQQRGHSTEKAVQQHYSAPVSPDREEQFLEGAARAIDTGSIATNKRTAKMQSQMQFEAELQAQRREMLDALREKPSPADADKLSLSDLAKDLLDEDEP